MSLQSLALSPQVGFLSSFKLLCEQRVACRLHKAKASCLAAKRSSDDHDATAAHQEVMEVLEDADVAFAGFDAFFRHCSQELPVELRLCRILS